MSIPCLGVGLGYRTQQHDDIAAHRRDIDFLELVTDQFIFSNEEKFEEMLAAADGLPLVPHSLSMSVGTAATMDRTYLAFNADFVRKVNAPWFGDHLCFTKVPEMDLGCLTPLWFTEEAADNAVRNIKAVKEAIPNTPFIVENITYIFPVGAPAKCMTEAAFITTILERADCGLLLDLNNVFVNSRNLGFDPYDFLNSIPLERVIQIHIAGHEESKDMVIDTHDAPVSEEVWDLLSFVAARSPVKGVLLERDGKFPPFSEMVEELNHARRIMSNS